MKKALAIALAAAAALCGSAAEPLELKIYSGAPDTIRTASTTIVAVTAPGASASIAGAPVHVYKTGSFGAKVDLVPGLNRVDVTARKDGREASRTLDIFFDTVAVAKAAPRPAPVESRFLEPRWVETLPGAYLQYGNGQDRLGGSKMGFLDEGIVLKAVGSMGDLLCVALGDNRTAWLPTEYSKPADAPAVAGAVNTGSWSVADAGSSDRVSIALPRRLAYHYSTGIEPSVITVDVYGATDNSNWITQRTLTLGIIDYVDFKQIDSDVYRVELHLKGSFQWGFHVGYEGNNLVIDVRHKPAAKSLKGMVIGLDAGHGGPYPGAKSPSGLIEKEVNLDIIKHMQAMLEAKGARVVMTRDGDTGPSMGERKRIWREAGVDLAVSVHNNSGGGALNSPGTAVLYKHLFCRPMAQAVTARLLETGLPLFGIVQNFNFSLNGPTEFPEVLIEGMFMSSLEEEEKLADPEFRRLVARKIVDGLEDYIRTTLGGK